MNLDVKFAKNAQTFKAGIAENNLTFEIGITENVQTFKAGFMENNRDFGASLGEIQVVTEYVGGEPYEGEYTVTPQVEAQILPTKEKILLGDIAVKAIPFYEVSNTSGGDTVFIGNEV